MVLGWPAPELIWNPPGHGVRVVAELARKKIEGRLSKLAGGNGVRVGLLTSEPRSDTGQAPLALVCEFPRRIPPETLYQVHRLAWNFSRSPLLLVVEPHQLRAFSCCEPPQQEEIDDTLQSELREARYDFHSEPQRATDVLHWLSLANGVLFQRYVSRFDRSRTADSSLMSNLKHIRQKLLDAHLDTDVIHDLLARIIFIQFLFQRCDSNGKAALSAARLARMCEEGRLSQQYNSLGEILSSHEDTYAIFRYLNEKFNGDLFPGKEDTETEREQGWRREMEQVSHEHLRLLCDFVEGRMELQSGQYSLWPLYSFDTIPLEFISSLYEAFVRKEQGTVYTPVHLVDFILDGVLPWNDTNWDIKILDPACGSGIFLVRAFQRLAYRWRLANPGKPLRSDTLRRILERNLTGIDINPHAVRVASFSLYLAMCDEIDPRHYWQQVRFPRLRDRRLLEGDFFSGDIQTNDTTERYDIVVGNPPWGKTTVTLAAKEWAGKHGWPITYSDIGPLFVAKAATLTRSDGYVSLMQPTGSLLVNTSTNALELRRKLFDEFQVSEVANLSRLRFGLFREAVGPASVITLQPKRSDSEYQITYIVIKPSGDGSDDYRFVIEPYDVHEISSFEATNDATIWSVLTWGGARDLALLRRLNRFPTLAKWYDDLKCKKRRGVIRGDRKKKQEKILKLRMLSSDSELPQHFCWSLNPVKLPLNKDPWTHSKDSTSLSAFRAPQLLVKLGWRKNVGRFRAVKIPKLSSSDEGALCSDRYLAIHASPEHEAILDAACLSFNSIFATYFLLLTSGQFSNYRDTTNAGELLNVPCPPLREKIASEPRSYEEVDERVRMEFGFKSAEWVLIEDLFFSTLPYFKDGISRPTIRGKELHDYCNWFLRVMHASFGKDKSIGATVFEEVGESRLPVRLVAIHLRWPSQDRIRVVRIDEGALADQVLSLQSILYNENSSETSVYRRVARVFCMSKEGEGYIPTLYIIKPDRARYWTRSMALRDADEVAMEMVSWQSAMHVEEEQ